MLKFYVGNEEKIYGKIKIVFFRFVSSFATNSCEFDSIYTRAKPQNQQIYSIGSILFLSPRGGVWVVIDLLWFPDREILIGAIMKKRVWYVNCCIYSRPCHFFGIHQYGLLRLSESKTMLFSNAIAPGIKVLSCFNYPPSSGSLETYSQNPIYFLFGSSAGFSA